MKILVLLQNAWRYRGGRSWRRSAWLKALAKSRTGRRLSVMLGDDCFERTDIVFDNASTLIGADADSKFPPDEAHVRSLLDRIVPDVVVACGLPAGEVVIKLWKGPLLCVPHPANRVLTNKLLLEAKSLLFGEPAYAERLILRQGRGVVGREEVKSGRVEKGVA